MEVFEVNSKEFSNILSEPFHVFGSGAFAALNRDKAEKVHFLLFKDSKYRLGFTGGIRNNALYSPFSAPFGGFLYLNESVKISQIEKAVEAMVDWAKDQKIESIHITLPPTIYHESFIAKQTNVLYRNQFEMDNLDLNFSFDTELFTEDYSSIIWRNARKNLNIAFENELTFHYCHDKEHKINAYQVIKANRETRGFPLRMTWHQVEETTILIDADFFVLKTKEGVSIASALVFHVSKNIVQVIYWGDLPEYAHLKTMNFLSYKVFEYYKEHNIRIIDIGPSTESSAPNYGLCEFKESIGCSLQTKMSFVRKI